MIRELKSSTRSSLPVLRRKCQSRPVCVYSAAAAAAAAAVDDDDDDDDDNDVMLSPPYPRPGGGRHSRTTSLVPEGAADATAVLRHRRPRGAGKGRPGVGQSVARTAATTDPQLATTGHHKGRAREPMIPDTQHLRTCHAAQVKEQDTEVKTRLPWRQSCGWWTRRRAITIPPHLAGRRKGGTRAALHPSGLLPVPPSYNEARALNLYWRGHRELRRGRCSRCGAARPSRPHHLVTKDIRKRKSESRDMIPQGDVGALKYECRWAVTNCRVMNQPRFVRVKPASVGIGCGTKANTLGDPSP
ncbi:hypothetical protein E2C01_027987 [Portunus trituberculatus]|uniref:Uncharacterized protein n=1 Tax=Portunus trituberculatus TaxID=210409 RepID=A0A5B7ENV9_PORTR|nr:hypothetical protein [Portunus trituberculatus]